MKVIIVSVELILAVVMTIGVSILVLGVCMIDVVNETMKSFKQFIETKRV